MIKFNFEEGVQFDPGYVQHLTAFIPNIEYTYADINRYRNFAQKKQKFKMYYNKILNLLENYLGFYLGCILWAACIKDENKPVLNNLCFGGEYNEDETLEEVNFIYSFIHQLKKDVKYYTGQDYEPDDFYFAIVNEYKEFLKLNKGFVNVNSSSDIVLSERVQKLSKEDKDFILEKIAGVVENGNFKELYPLNVKLFN